MCSIRSLLYRYRLLFWGVTLLLNVAHLTGCHPSVDPDQGFGPDGQPRILTVQLPGLPDQNVQVDQVARQIIITIPSSFSLDVITPVFTLTPQTQLTKSAGNSVKIYPLTQNDSVRLVTDTQRKNAYAVIFKPTENLAFALLNAPLSYSVDAFGTTICLPIFNFIDGQSTGTLTLINQQTGHQLTRRQNPGFFSICDRSARTDGAVILEMYFNGQDFYEPGSYTVQFSKPNGRQATLNQPLLISRGQTRLFIDSNFPFVLGSTSPRIYAANLFPTDESSLVLRSRGKDPVSLPAQSIHFLTTQPGLELPVLIGLQPGYYYAQLLTKGQPTATYVRLPVVASSKDLAILNLYGYTPDTYNLLDASLPFDQPVRLTRGTAYGLTTNAFLYTTQPNDHSTQRIYLQSVLTPTQTYIIGLTPGPSALKLPTSVEPGRYQLHFELVLGDGSVLKTEPLERDVMIE